MKIRHLIISNNSKDNWRNNDIQFPRLLSEIWAVGLTAKQVRTLRAAMDLSGSEINRIFNRADKVWQKIKERTIRGRITIAAVPHKG